MRFLAAFLVSCVLLCGAASASAQTTAIVLGIRSVEGDDDVAHDVTQALRAAASKITGWEVSAREVSMTQMTLANGCEEIDAACLSQIAKSLEVSRIVYGSVRRTSAQAEYSYELTVSVFDAEKGSITRTLNETIPRDQTSFQAMGERSERLIKRLSTAGHEGAILVAANVADADVRLDGEPVGRTSSDGLRLDGVSPGEHKVEIIANGYAPHLTRVTVETGGEVSVHAELTAVEAAPPQPATRAASPSDGGGVAWLGWTLIGVGAASAVGAGISAGIVGGVSDDALFKDYKMRIATYNENVGPADEVSDACVEAERGQPHGLSRGEIAEVADLCLRADTFEVLQWVFLGTAVAAGVGGTVILLTADGDDGDAARGSGPDFALRPIFDGRTASMSARLRF
jgi:hypothetical protein